MNKNKACCNFREYFRPKTLQKQAEKINGDFHLDIKCLNKEKHEMPSYCNLTG